MQKVQRTAIVAGLGALGLGVVAGVWPATAEVPVSSVGWWTKAASKPTVPAGGLAVGRALDGSDETVGALALEVGGGASGATVRLPEAPGGSAQSLGALQVCRGVSFTAANGGPLDAAPSSNCDGAVTLARGADNAWTGDLSPLLGGRTGTVPLVVKPGNAVVPFTIVFAAPSVAGSTTSATTSPPPTDPPTTSPSSSGGGGGGGGGFTPSPTSPPFSFDPPSSPVTEPVAPPSTAAPSSEQAAPPQLVQPTGAARRSIQNAAASSSDSEATKATVIFWFFLSGLVGAGAAGISWAKSNGKLSLAGLRGSKPSGGSPA